MSDSCNVEALQVSTKSSPVAHCGAVGVVGGSKIAAGDGRRALFNAVCPLSALFIMDTDYTYMCFFYFPN